MKKAWEPPPREKRCLCPEPVGDPREGTCLKCGHQVAGKPMPNKTMEFLKRG